jgi:hypothetical protein
MEDKTFLLIMIVPGFLILLALLSFIGNGEAFGLSPISKSCIGKKISRETVEKYFPYGEAELKSPLHLKYWVLEKGDEKVFCLGQNVW